jgi:AcrR family transcriptional regulator
MNKQAKKPMGSPRERIMSVATELFYRQGYRATGINEVIQKSGVAKATFYNHFPSKDDLGMAYLTYLKEGEIAVVDQAIRAARNPVGRFLAVIQSLGPWAVDTDFRGCGFLNMASEVPDPKSPLRKVGRDLYDGIRSRVEQLSKELIASDPRKYKSYDVRELTDEYMVIFVGAVALAEIYHDIWPVEHAVDAARRLIGQTTG